MKKILLLLLITVNLQLLTINSFAQDIHFSQTYMTPLELNPANAGTEYDVRGILNYRTQWSSVSTQPFVTMMAAYDMNFKKSSSKIGYFAGGIFLFKDKAGDSKMNQTNANLAIAYHVNLDDKNTLGLGIQGGYFQRNVDLNTLKWGNQYDGFNYNSQISTGESIGNYSVAAPDFASGLTWTYRKGERYMSGNNQLLIISGLSIQHINKPKIEYRSIVNDPFYYRWVGHATAIIGIPNTKISILPSAVYLHQGSLNEILVGTNFSYRFKEASKYTGNLKGGTIGMGVEYRLQDAFIITSFIEIANYSIGLSYDLNTSSLSGASKNNGGFEIALRYVHPSPFSKGRSASRFK